jgi:selenide,water dikinase
VLRRVQWKQTQHLLHGNYRDEDAAVVRLPDGRLLAATVDVFSPIVDDPYEFGRIGAANSLSDIYAMGGTPRFALSVLAYPPSVFGPETAARILQGAIDKASEAGVVVAGGHTVKSGDVFFGLSVVGDFPEGRILEKQGACPGDALVLTKPLGTGILATALKRGVLPEAAAAEMLRLATTLNDRASRLAVAAGAHACTDITGFGLLGHLGEIVRASGVRAVLQAAAVPLLPEVLRLADAGLVPGGTIANLAFASGFTRFAGTLSYPLKVALADAQTSGGLLLALDAAGLASFARLCQEQGQSCSVIGRLEPGEPGIDVA